MTYWLEVRVGEEGKSEGHCCVEQKQQDFKGHIEVESSTASKYEPKISDDDNNHDYNGHNECDKEISDKKYKGFAVIESYTIIDPRTMVVHIQHTNLTFWAVMSPFWFEVVTY